MKKIYLLLLALVGMMSAMTQIIPTKDVVVGQKYNIKDVAADMYLQYLDGFVCNPINGEEGVDPSYDFVVIPVEGVADTYHLSVLGQYLNGSGSYSLVLGNDLGSVGQLRLISAEEDENTFRLETVWSKRIGRDDQNAGSRYYADKSPGVLFYLEISPNGYDSDESMIADKKIELGNEIDLTADFLDSKISEIGDEPGQFPQSAYDILSDIIDDSQIVVDDQNVSWLDVHAAITVLKTGIKTFEASANKVDFSPKLNAFYRVFSADQDQYPNHYLYSTGTGNDVAQKHAELTDMDDESFLYRFVKDGDKWKILPYADIAKEPSQRRYIYERGSGGNGMQARAKITSADESKFSPEFLKRVDGVDYYIFKSVRNNYLFFGTDGNDLKSLNTYGATDGEAAYQLAIEFVSEDESTPKVESLLPKNEAENVSISSKIQVVFSNFITAEDLSAVSINGNPVASVQIDDNTLTITYDLKYGTQYQVSIPEGTLENVYDEISWSFTTVQLAVSSLMPADEVDYVNLKTPVKVSFNENIEEDDLSLITINGSPVEAVVSGKTLTITHDDFDYLTLYTVSIPEGSIKDYNEDIEWSFTTVMEPVLPDFGKRYFIKHLQSGLYLTLNLESTDNITKIDYFFGDDTQTFTLMADELNPELVSISSNDVFLTQNTQWRWDINAGTDATEDEAKYILVPNGDRIAIKALFYKDDNMYLAPQNNQSGTKCYLDTGGSPENINNLWIFEEITEEDVLEAVEFLPENNTLDVTNNVTLSVLFSKVIELSENPLISIKDQDNNEVDGVEPEVQGRRLFIDHDMFSFGNTYTVIIPAGTIIGLDEAVTWSFTTATPVYPKHLRSYNIINVRNDGYLTLPVEAPHNESVVSASAKINDKDSITQIFQFLIPDMDHPDQFNIAVYSGEYLTKPAKSAWQVSLGTDPNDDEAKVLVTAEGLNIQFQALAHAGNAGRYLGLNNNNIDAPCFWDKSGEPAMWRLEEVTMPLSLISSDPSNGATEVDINTPIHVSFNQGVNLENVSLITLKNSKGEAVGNLEVTIEDNVLVINHDALDFETTYTVEIPVGTIEGYEQSKSWTFTTKEGPKVEFTTPETDATNVSVTAAVNVFFTQEVSLSGKLTDIIIKDDNNQVVSGIDVVMPDETAVRINHPMFDYNRTYTVIVPSNTFAGVNEQIEWSFTTTTPPVLKSTVPENNAIDVPLDTKIQVVFTKKIEQKDFSNITVSDDQGNQFNDVISSSSATLTIAHTTLSDGTTYTVTVPANSIHGVQEEIVFSFTTQKSSGLSGLNNLKDNISIYPTLSSGKLTIKTNDKAWVQIVDYSGKMLDSYDSDGEIEIELNYPNGLYLVKVNTGVVTTHKIILNK